MTKQIRNFYCSMSGKSFTQDPLLKFVSLSVVEM